jgi:hypothetical protein
MNQSVPVAEAPTNPHEPWDVPVVPVELASGAPACPSSEAVISDDEIERLAELARRYQEEDRNG